MTGSGRTYSATNASSWGMVSANGGAAAWKKVCTKYQYKDADGNVLHTGQYAVWYSGDLGGSNCTSSTCGQNTAFTETW